MSKELITPIQALECVRLAKQVLIACGIPGGIGNNETEGIGPGREDRRFNTLDTFQAHPTAKYMELAVSNQPVHEDSFINKLDTKRSKDLPQSNVEISYWDITSSMTVTQGDPAEMFYHISYEGDHYKRYGWQRIEKAVIAQSMEELESYAPALHAAGNGVITISEDPMTGMLTGVAKTSHTDRSEISLPEADLVIADLRTIVEAAK
jgi:hypothetical protein